MPGVDCCDNEKCEYYGMILPPPSYICPACGGAEQRWGRPSKPNKASKAPKLKGPAVDKDLKQRAVAAGVSLRKVNKYKNDAAGLEAEIQRALDADIARIKKGAEAGTKKK
jgi:hypothetical protein